MNIVVKKQSLTKSKKQTNVLQNLEPFVSKKVSVIGIITKIFPSRNKILIDTNNLNIYGILKDDKKNESIKKILGKEVTISGIGHFNKNGNLEFIEIKKIIENLNINKNIISEFKTKTAKEQLENYIKSKPKSNIDLLKSIVGIWHTNISDEELDKLIKEI